MTSGQLDVTKGNLVDRKKDTWKAEKKPPEKIATGLQQNRQKSKVKRRPMSRTEPPRAVDVEETSTMCISLKTEFNAYFCFYFASLK